MANEKCYSPDPTQEIDFYELRDRQKKLCPNDPGLSGPKTTSSNTEVLMNVRRSTQNQVRFDDFYIPFDCCESI